MDSSLFKTLPDLSKLEALDGSNYKRWAQRLLIFFEQLEIDYVLHENCPERPIACDANPDDNLEEKSKKYEQANKLVRGHLLSHMTNALFDLFISNKSAKAIWETLEKKYETDDAGKKKYATGKWLQFKMVDDKPIMNQVHEYENLVADILTEGMKMCDVLQANVLIKKLPDTWSNYRNHLKHKKRDMSLEELLGHMKIEEANRLKDKFSSPNELSVKANIVESSVLKPDRFNRGKDTKGNFKRNQEISKEIRTRSNLEFRTRRWEALRKMINTRKVIGIALPVESQGTRLGNVITAKTPQTMVKSKIGTRIKLMLQKSKIISLLQ